MTGPWLRGHSLVAIAFGLLAYGCAPAPVPNPHYQLGAPYQVGSVWRYPREEYDLDATGIAAVSADSASRLTADGEVFDQTAMAAAHPTIQLPAIARLTNLDNGLETIVRINDRGTGDPHRLVEITKRTALLLRIQPEQPARVRLKVLPAESHDAAEALPGAPTLAMTAAPRGGVEVAELAPLPGTRQGGGHAMSDAGHAGPVAAAPNASPLRLPETLIQRSPAPGQLMVELDTFDEYHYAAQQAAKMTGMGAQVVSFRNGRSQQFRTVIGPLPTVARADAVLDQALRFGIPDAQIIIQ